MVPNQVSYSSLALVLFSHFSNYIIILKIWDNWTERHRNTYKYRKKKWVTNSKGAPLFPYLVICCYFNNKRPYMTSVMWKSTCKKRQIFGIQNCVKFVLFKVQSYIWYQNNQKFENLLWNNSSAGYTWQHSHHGMICPTLFWTLNRSIFPQHSSYGHRGLFKRSKIILYIECTLWKHYKLFCVT